MQAPPQNTKTTKVCAQRFLAFHSFHALPLPVPSSPQHVAALVYCRRRIIYLRAFYDKYEPTIDGHRILYDRYDTAGTWQRYGTSSAHLRSLSSHWLTRCLIDRIEGLFNWNQSYSRIYSLCEDFQWILLMLMAYSYTSMQVYILGRVRSAEIIVHHNTARPPPTSTTPLPLVLHSRHSICWLVSTPLEPSCS
jgi:hypothetical protein